MQQEDVAALEGKEGEMARRAAASRERGLLEGREEGTA